MHVHVHVCMHVCVHACVYVRNYVSMYACVPLFMRENAQFAFVLIACLARLLVYTCVLMCIHLRFFSFLWVFSGC